MKPSEWIVKRAKERAADDVLAENPYMNWEARDDLTAIRFASDSHAYLLLATFDWLDQEAK